MQWGWMRQGGLFMSEEGIYRLFIEWMKKSWYGLPEAEEMIPCIGCGVCAHKRPAHSLILERREVITDPPLDGRDYVKRFMADRQAAQPGLERK